MITRYLPPSVTKRGVIPSAALLVWMMLAGLVLAGRDYYDLLGIPRDAPDSVIKKAYRQMARRYHPDKHPGDTKMEQKFKDISQAYEVLSDREKRQMYDQFGEDGLRSNGGQGGHGGGGGGFGNFGFHGGRGGPHGFRMEFDESMFHEMFNGFGGGNGGGGGHNFRQQRQQRRRVCFENKVCENGSCFMVKECKS